ncbi:MAG: universal stress protein [Cyanobacteria bacterium]|nr:universal stress protein [Cyanobacteriota bacterium]
MKIIVALDGSPSAEAAFDTLGKLKWPNGTEIKLLAVVAAVEGFGAKRTESAAKHQQDFVEVATEAIEELAQTIRANLSHCIITTEVVRGDAKSRIVEAAQQWQANLVIMGSRGRKELESMFLGSVSQAVILQSPCPVIVARSVEDPDESYRTIIVTVDNSPYSRAMLDWMTTLEWDTKTNFRIVTIVPPLIDTFRDLESGANASGLMSRHSETMDSAKAELQQFASRLISHVGANRVTMQVAEGDPREVILTIAADSGADLIVLGSHGRTGLDRILIGSVSQAIAMHAPCSVAIVRGLVPKGKGKSQPTGVFSVIPNA